MNKDLQRLQRYFEGRHDRPPEPIEEPEWHTHHSPGAKSWRDCRYRMTGCYQCQEETIREEHYPQTHISASGRLEPYTSALEAFLDGDTGRAILQRMEEAQAYAAEAARISATFWKGVRDYMRRQKA